MPSLARTSWVARAYTGRRLAGSTARSSSSAVAHRGFFPLGTVRTEAFQNQQRGSRVSVLSGGDTKKRCLLSTAAVDDHTHGQESPSRAPRPSTSPIDGRDTLCVDVMSHPQFPSNTIVECLTSGIQYVDPWPSDAELARVYDEDYNASFGRDFSRGVPSFVARRARAQWAFVRANVCIASEEHSLRTAAEVGGGWGELSRVLTTEGGLESVRCYELDSEAVSFMRAHRGVDAVLGRLEDARGPAQDADGSLDLVASSMMLEHVPRPLDALKQWRAKLRDGGYLFAEIPLENPVPNWWGRDPARPYWVGHLTFFGQGHLEQMLIEAGFSKIVAATPHDHPVSPGYLMPGDAASYDCDAVPLDLDTAVSDSTTPKLLRVLAQN